MREYNFNIETALRNGLRPDARQPLNSEHMTYMKNVKPSEMGAVSPESVTYPIDTPALSVSWPFPQLFRGRSVTLLAYGTSVYLVDESDWSTTLLATYDWANWSSTKSITAGGPWHFMDFHTTWMLFNGNCQVFKVGYSSKTFVQDAVTITTGTNWNDGRAVYAGFDTSDFRSSGWASFLEEYSGNAPEEIQAALSFTAGADKNWVWWSTIGGGDLLWLFDHNLMVYGSLYDQATTGYGPDNPYVFALWARNECGVMPMPHQGRVIQVRQLGDSLVVYGEDGVNALYSDGSGAVGQRPILGLGRGVGIACRSAAGGGYDRHVFVDKAGELWTITPDLKAERLGYGEFFAPMLTNDIVVSFDPLESDYWISDENECYVLSRTGLGGPMSVRPTNLERDSDGYLSGAALGLDASSTEVHMCSGAFDLSERGTKHVAEIASAYSGLTSGQVRVGYKYQHGGSLAYAPWSKCNLQGVAFPGVSFMEGNISLKGTVDGGAIVNRIEVRYNPEDLSYRRGTKGIPEEG